MAEPITAPKKGKPMTKKELSALLLALGGLAGVVASETGLMEAIVQIVSLINPA